VTDARGNPESSADNRRPRTVEYDADVVFHDSAEEKLTNRSKSNNNDCCLTFSAFMKDSEARSLCLRRCIVCVEIKSLKAVNILKMRFLLMFYSNAFGC
jgi:hypothetical protein